MLVDALHDLAKEISPQKQSPPVDLILRYNRRILSEILACCESGALSTYLGIEGTLNDRKK